CTLTKKVSMYYEIVKFYNHDTIDYKLIDQIHESMEIGVCQNSVARGYKEYECHNHEGCNNKNNRNSGLR
ncbi:hypothetical protein KI387_030108, partial [Taxus chinensis]